MDSKKIILSNFSLAELGQLVHEIQKTDLITSKIILDYVYDNFKLKSPQMTDFLFNSWIEEFDLINTAQQK